MKKLFCILALLAMAAWASAANVEGVDFGEAVQVGNTRLALNGASVRGNRLLKAYAVGLYVTEKKHSADELLALKGAKRLHMVVLFDLTADQFADALVQGIRKNVSDAEMAQLQPRIDRFKSKFQALKLANKGAVIDIDWLPKAGTRLIFNGRTQGDDIRGKDFYRALLLIWLGEHPPEARLKDALLGQPN